MTETNDDLVIYANTKHVLAFSVLNADDNDNPLPLTGLTVQWSLARKTERGYEGQATVFKDTTSGGITVTDAPGGKLEVSIDPADTEALLGDFHQELEVVDGVGRGVVVAVGNVTIFRNVSGQ